MSSGDRDMQQRRIEAARAVHEVLLAVDRLVAGLDVWDPHRTAIVLLALKSGPSTPAAVARKCRLSQDLVRQRLHRYAAAPIDRRLVERQGAGRYRLTRRGHRRVNDLVGLGVHVLLPRLRALAVTGVTSTMDAEGAN